MQKIRQFLKKKTPPFLVFLKNALPIYYYDLVRYYKGSATMGLKNEKQLIGQIIKTYHVVEKGLTMPETKLGFGKAQLMYLVKNCNLFFDRHGINNEQFLHAIGVLTEYKHFHEQNSFQLDSEVDNQISSLLKKVDNLTHCTQQAVTTADEYYQYSESAFPLFSNSRHSVRNYSNDPVDIEVIKEAINLARNTPSACNRQTARVYVYTDKKQIGEILVAQGGNRGFGHLADKLIVVTAELGVFIGLNERNQAFIDGGMYAMNLLYALHSYKIAACILNCSVLPHKDAQIRSLTNIKESEVLIAMISCGNLPDKLQLATSKRTRIEEVAEVIS